MSRMTAAFVCALCDPDDPRPASIMCSNNCGRYVCAVHAMPRKGPGSAMVCLSCAEALGLLEKPKPKAEPAPVVAATVTAVAAAAILPKAEPVEVKPPTPAPTPAPIEPAPAPQAQPPVSAAVPPVAPVEVEKPIEQASEPPKAATPIVATPLPDVRPLIDIKPLEPPAEPKPAPLPGVKPLPIVDQPAAQRFDADATLVNVPPLKKVEPSTVIPADQQSAAARRLVEPPPPPQSSETIVSQRGNTLQVPKVTQTGPRPVTQNTGARPRVAQRAAETTGNPNTQLILMAAGSVVMGIVGFVLILLALAG